MKNSLLLASLAAVAAQATGVPLPAATMTSVLPPPDEAAALGFIQTLDNHMRKVKVQPVLHAWTRLRQLLAVRQPLTPMGEKRVQWYFDCDGHYIDVVKDELGKYSVFFRDRTDQTEGWRDQADPAIDPTILREMFEAKYGREEDPKRFLWIDADGKYKSAPLQHAWEIWQHAYVAMSERIAPLAPPRQHLFVWTAFAVRRPPENTHIIWRSTADDIQVGIGYYCDEDANEWTGDWIAVSDLQKLPQ